MMKVINILDAPPVRAQLLCKPTRPVEKTRVKQASTLVLPRDTPTSEVRATPQRLPSLSARDFSADEESWFSLSETVVQSKSAVAVRAASPASQNGAYLLGTVIGATLASGVWMTLGLVVLKVAVL
jgi:hypothetical protein